MIKGILPIGLAFRKEDSTQYDYYISPKLFYEYTGYVYNEAYVMLRKSVLVG